MKNDDLQYALIMRLVASGVPRDEVAFIAEQQYGIPVIFAEPKRKRQVYDGDGWITP